MRQWWCLRSGEQAEPPGPHRGGRGKPRSVRPYLCQGPEFESHLHPIRPHRSWLDELISPLPIPHHTPTGTQFILQTSRGSGRPKKIAIFQPSQAALKTKALFFMLFNRNLYSHSQQATFYKGPFVIKTTYFPVWSHLSPWS